MQPAAPAQVVVVGAGFGGLAAIRQLESSPLAVKWVDRNNYHAFLPLLYQVAAAELEPNSIAYPARTILRNHRQMQFLLAEITELDLDGQTLHAKQAQLHLHYDYLILALGSAHNFLGIPGAAEYALPLKSVTEAVALRNRILNRFEQASLETDPQRRRQLLSFTIVGGGPTGVEYAGALAELIRGPLERDFPRLDLRQVRILILEHAPTLLPGMAPQLQEYALRRLQRMGVETQLKTTVARVTPETVELANGGLIRTATVVWTAGVQGEPLARRWGLPMVHGGRVQVEPTLQLPGHPMVYVVGDLAGLEWRGQLLPQVAPVAIQQGQTAAGNIQRQIHGQTPQPFVYKDLGSMVVIGRNAAVAQLRGGHGFCGWPAWVLWAGVHLLNLVGFRNRLVVMINWALDYFFFERGVRLMLPGANNR